eukprot:7210846-Ditylum_brightwellii.AAC.1
MYQDGMIHWVDTEEEKKQNGMAILKIRRGSMENVAGEKAHGGKLRAKIRAPDPKISQLGNSKLLTMTDIHH